MIEITALGAQTTNDYPLVSLIIPAYNHEKYVAQAILSAINQTYDNIEIIIIDDGSKDATASVIQDVIEKHGDGRNIIFISQANHGLSKTLNKALAIAQGEYVQFLASDDAYTPEKTSRCLALLRGADASVAAVYSDGYLINDTGNKVGLFSEKYIRPLSGSTYKELLIVNWIPAMGVLYKKAAIDAVGRFDENLKVEDYDLLLRISRRYKLLASREKLFLYRLHETNSMKSTAMILEQMDLTARKHKEIQNFREFLLALKNRSALGVLTSFNFLNIELLAR